MTFFTTSANGWDASSVWLASVIAGACCALIFIAVKIHKEAPAKNDKQSDAAILIHVDAKSKELAGLVNALAETVLSWSFKLPVPAGDPFLARYEALKESEHPIWTDSATNQLRRDFLNRCGRIGSKEISYTAAEIRDLHSELNEIAIKLKAALLGRDYASTQSNFIDWKPMFEAVLHVARHIDDQNAKECFPTARQAIRQAALDKKITIRGNKSAELMGNGYSEVETDILAVYWETADIGPMATDKAADAMPPHTFPHQFSNGHYGEKIFLYAKLRIRWDEVLKRWPS